MKHLKTYESHGELKVGYYAQINVPTMNNDGSLARFRNFINTHTGKIFNIKGDGQVEIEYFDIPQDIKIHFFNFNQQDHTYTIFVNPNSIVDCAQSEVELSANKYNL